MNIRLFFFLIVTFMAGIMPICYYKLMMTFKSKAKGIMIGAIIYAIIILVISMWLGVTYA